ncbi:MAG: cation transporter [candidate division KSB1 bacterium]|nr:cation transporter [candidate division KSB1 bacterium]MDZ7346007.1 cation transporter [candidate division KSB1 bacterium]
MKKLLNIFLSTIFILGALSFAAEKKVEIAIDGMTCNNCVEKVKTALQKVEGVKNAEVSLEKRNAIVTYDDSKTDEKTLKQAVNAAGFKAKEAKAPEAKGCCPKTSGCCAGAKK